MLKSYMRDKNMGTYSTVFALSIVFICVNFLGRGNLFAVAALVLNVALLLWKRGEFEFDLNCLYGILFIVGGVFAAGLFFDAFEAIKSVNVLAAYLVGYWGYKQYETEKEKAQFIKLIAFSAFLGFSAYLIATFIFNELAPWKVNRCLYNVWGENYEMVSVTLIGMVSSVVIGYSFYAFFFQRNLFLRIYTGIALLITLLLNVKTSTRTPLLLFVIVYAFMFVLSLGKLKKRTQTAVWISFGGIVAVVATVLLTNVFGIRDALMSIPLVKRLLLEGLSTPRVEEYIAHFNNMPNRILGGLWQKYEVGNYAHNFLQDAYDCYGVLALLSMLGYSVLFIINAFKLVFGKNKTSVEYLLISMQAAMLIQLCLEPIFSGYPILMWMVMLLHGGTTARLEGRASK